MSAHGGTVARMAARRKCPVCHRYVDSYTDERLVLRIEGHHDKARNPCQGSHYEFAITIAPDYLGDLEHD